MKNKNLIAIDGPAASGKGTLARKIAEHLGFGYMDTGLLYRAIGLKVLKENINPEDAARALAAGALNLNKNLLRGEEISEAASKSAAIPAVRRALFDLQRNFAANPPAPYKGAILDGRDIGTIICPDACAKIFVTAAPEIRARRRLKELQSAGLEATYEAVLRDMRGRDERDAAREASPVKPAGDAVILDTSDMNAEEAFKKALEIIAGKCGLSA
ncbi:MAG: (d)CMP kinase [Alphaproteobacteria bacterium]